MNKKTIVGLLLVAVVTLGGVPQALALGSYTTSFNTKYGTSGTNGGTTLGSCITCHTSPTGGAGWNDYGLDVQTRLAAGDSITQALTNIEANDSDKDTFSNIVEINAGTFPGDPNSHPASDTPPVIAITSPTDGQTFTTDAITVSGTASDDVGVSKVEVKIGAGGSYVAATGNTSWSAPVTLASGSNTIYARATDTAGQTTETSVTVNYNPQTPPSGTPPSTAVKVTFLVLDNETGSPIAGAKVSMNGSKIKTDDNGTAIFTNVVPGDYKYKVSAEEYEKNKDSISVTGDITVTVKLVPETEEDEHDEDGTHEQVHWLENTFEKTPCTGSTAGVQNDGHAGQDK